MYGFGKRLRTVWLLTALCFCGCSATPEPPESVQETALPSANSPDALTEYTVSALAAALPEMTLSCAVPSDAVEPALRAAQEQSVLLRTGLTGFRWTLADGVLKCEFRYSTDADALLRERTGLALYAAQFAESAAQFSLPECALLAHDRLLRECRYTEGAVQGDSAAGALLYHEAECGGFAEAFALLAEFCALPCRIINGTANGTPHAWNLVQLEGIWYHIDCAWDADASDPHAYFLCSDSDMAPTHKWDCTAYPAADGGALSYSAIVSEMPGIRGSSPYRSSAASARISHRIS